MKKPKKTILLVASGDLRPSANTESWSEQAAMEKKIAAAAKKLGYTVKRAHPYKKEDGHGFIASQREGMEIFKKLDPAAPIIVAEAIWQYSHHVLPGLTTHKGPILTLANWSGTWSGLVGMLNLNASMTKAGVAYSTLWSETFDDPFFLKHFETWLKTGKVTHKTPHVHPIARAKHMPAAAVAAAKKIARQWRREKIIMGVFDEGCMGMHNAIIPEELLMPAGVFKERLSQSALFYEMSQVGDAEAKAVYDWLLKKGMKFVYGKDPKKELTPDQVLEQCKMYVAAVRIGDRFGCDAVGIQYQQGLKDLCAASDMIEGILNNADRPPVKNAKGQVIKQGQPFTHFNEADECAGLDAVMTQRVQSLLKQPTENTLHDIRWGDLDRSGTTGKFLWVFMISGGAPAAHHIGGYKGTVGYRQDPVFFPKGGATCSGVAKPGEIIWSRIYIENGKLCMDLGRGGIPKLPESEVQRRLKLCTPVWPIMNAELYGVSRDQLMARHKANHIQVAYANSAEAADKCMYTKAALARELGLNVFLCGTRKDGKAF